MEDSLAFSQELPQLGQPYGSPYSVLTTNTAKYRTEATPLVEQSSRYHETVSEESYTAAGYKRLKPLVYGILATSALGSFLWGYNLSVIAGALLLISEHFPLTVLWRGVVVSIMIGGATVGSVTAGILNDRLGRWPVMMMAAILFAVGALLMAFSIGSKVYLVVGRAISGVGIGFTTVTSSVYVAELVPSHTRGKLVFLSYVMTGGGVLAGAVVGGIFSINFTSNFAEDYGWRCILGFGFIPAVLMLIGLLFTPETPRWLVFHNRVDKARKVLHQVRHRSEVDDELDIITNARDTSTQGDSVNFIQFIKRLKDNKAVLYAFIVGCGLHIFRSLGGAVIILNYSSTIFHMAGFNQTKSIWLAVVPASANMIGKFVGNLLLGKMGRRKLYMLSSLGATFFLLLLAATFLVNDEKSSKAIPADPNGQCNYDTCGSCVANSNCGFCMATVGPLHGTCSKGNSDCDIYRYKLNTNKSCILKDEHVSNITTEWHFDNCPDTKLAPLAIVAACMYVVFFGLGLAPLPWIINSEIYPTWARGSAVAIGSMCNWVFSLLVALTFLPLVDIIGQTWVFSIYAIFVFLGFVFVLFLVPDTKGRDLEETEKLFTKLYFLTWCA